MGFFLFQAPGCELSSRRRGEGHFFGMKKEAAAADAQGFDKIL
jgi:hypothetical protein